VGRGPGPDLVHDLPRGRRDAGGAQSDPLGRKLLHGPENLELIAPWRGRALRRPPRAVSMKGASLSTSPSAISTECRSTSDSDFFKGKTEISLSSRPSPNPKRRGKFSGI